MESTSLNSMYPLVILCLLKFEKVWYKVKKKKKKSDTTDQFWKLCFEKINMPTLYKMDWLKEKLGAVMTQKVIVLIKQVEGHENRH